MLSAWAPSTSIGVDEPPSDIGISIVGKQHAAMQNLNVAPTSSALCTYVWKMLGRSQNDMRKSCNMHEAALSCETQQLADSMCVVWSRKCSLTATASPEMTGTLKLSVNIPHTDRKWGQLAINLGTRFENL